MGYLPVNDRNNIVLKCIKYAFISWFCLQELLRQTLGSVSFLYWPVGFFGLFVCFNP